MQKQINLLKNKIISVYKNIWEYITIVNIKFIYQM